jgi:NADPH:quinone reductase-like Zn-dependent oxidoreductase
MTMRAALVESCGEPPAVREHPSPQPVGDGVTVVRVTAASITPLDLLCASGTSYFGRPAVPYVPGVQGVGVTLDGAGSLAGREVWFPTTAGMRPGDGSMAELAVVEESAAVPLPNGLDAGLAAALGLSAVAALRALTVVGGLRQGDRVIVLGAGGAVGQAAVALAKHYGASRVVGAARSAEGRRRASDNGADAVVELSATDDARELTATMRDACEGDADLVVDPVYGVAATAALRALGPRGRLVNLGSAAAESASFDSATIRSRNLSVMGYTNATLTVAETAESIRTVFELAADGRLSVAYRAVPLDDVGVEWSRQLSGEGSERIVLRP